VYLFNPFYEHVDDTIHIDNALDFKFASFVEYVLHVQQKLKGLSPGARVVTLNGFGGDIPRCFRALMKEEIGGLSVEVWERKASWRFL
jgi:hypothetical protein